MGSDFIGALRTRLVVAGLGTRIMSGLKGDVSLPKLSGAVSAAFVGEGSAVLKPTKHLRRYSYSLSNLVCLLTSLGS